MLPKTANLLYGLEGKKGNSAMPRALGKGSSTSAKPGRIHPCVSTVPFVSSFQGSTNKKLIGGPTYLETTADEPSKCSAILFDMGQIRESSGFCGFGPWKVPYAPPKWTKTDLFDRTPQLFFASPPPPPLGLMFNWDPAAGTHRVPTRTLPVAKIWRTVLVRGLHPNLRHHLQGRGGIGPWG